MHVSDGEGVLALSESQGVRLLWVWHPKVTCWFLPQVSRGKGARSYRHHIWDLHFAWTIDRSRGFTTIFFFFPFHKTLLIHYGEPLVCVTVCMATTLHIFKAAAVSQQLSHRFSKEHLFLLHGQKALPLTGVLLCTVFNKWVLKVKVEIVSESHILNSQ